MFTLNSGLYAATFFPHFQPCGLYSDMIYVVILHFLLKLPGNVLVVAYNQVRLIVRHLRYLKNNSVLSTTSHGVFVPCPTMFLVIY